MRKYPAVFGGGIILWFLVLTAAEEPYFDAARMASHRLVRTSAPQHQSSPSINPSFGKMPLYFIRNEGQVDPSVGYYVQGKDKTIYFTSEGLTYVLDERGAGENRSSKAASLEGRRSINPPEPESRSPEARSRWVVKLDFVGANRDVRPAGEEKTEAAISYFRGSPKDWKTGLATYSRIVYRELWPGIDLIYFGTTDRLKYEFIVHPGADPSQIRLAYRGASAVEVNEEGRLEVVTPGGSFEDDAPAAFQEKDGRRVEVVLSYRIEGKSSGVFGEKREDIQARLKERYGSKEIKSFSYGFVVGEYDPSLPLVLDPAILVYCGYIGGKYGDCGNGIAVDGSGNAYIAGYTLSTQASFPVLYGPDLIHNGSKDAFVAKVNSSGTALLFCGYIGGESNDYGNGIAVDGSGNAYITGYTFSTQASFPVLYGPDLTHNGSEDAFVAKVNSSGTALLYCGYIGGESGDIGLGIAVDDSGNAHVAGYTYSTEASFPVLNGPDLIFNGAYDGFVAKVNSSGTALLYCGYIGGESGDVGSGIAVDGSGDAHVAGYTYSTEASFPVLYGPDLTHNGAYDVFVAKVNSSGTALLYCGYIGGEDEDYGNGIAVDGSGNAYVAGNTFSTQASFPVLYGPDLTHNGDYDVFVAKVNSSGTALLYCGYIGGEYSDIGLGIAVDGSGNAYVAGYTYSSQGSFPVLHGPDLTHNGAYDGFVAKVNSSGTALLYCGYIGGEYGDRGYGIAVDGSGNVYVTGSTTSTEASFPVLYGPDLTHNGSLDVFVAKIIQKEKKDFLATWDGQGVYYRNSESGKWIKLASPANLVAAGDLGGDGIDDLITVFPSVAGVWTRSSSAGTWTKLASTTAKHISSGDMNGDARMDVLATWDGSGVYYRNSTSGAWTKITQPANLLASGDLDGDSKDDPIIIFPTPAGVWVKYSKTGTWSRLSSTSAIDIASGDMNGDGRDDLLGTWDGTGIYYRDSISGGWVKMAVPGEQVTAGDLDGDGKDDLVGLWASQGGVWVKYSKTGAWAKLSTPVKDMAAGLMRGGFWGSIQSGFIELQGPFGGYAEGPSSQSGYIDLSNEGPGGWRFAAQEDNNLIPLESEATAIKVPGPGEPGFRCVAQKNLVPREDSVRENKRRRK